MQFTEISYYLQSAGVDQYDGKLNDLMSVVTGGLFPAGGLEVYHQQVVIVRVLLIGRLDVRFAKLRLCVVILQSFSQYLFHTPENTTIL